MTETALFIQYLLSGLYITGKYALPAIGLTLIFGVMGIADFAQGALYMLGALFTFYIATRFQVNYFLALLIATLLLVLIGILNNSIIYKRLRGFEINTLIAALGILLVIENIVVAIFGGKYLTVPSPFGETKFEPLPRVIITAQELLIVFASFSLIFLVWVFLNKTKTGKALRAMSQDRDAATLMGINIDRISSVTFGIAAGLAGIDGALVAPTQVILPQMGAMVILKAFVITVVGGMGSIWGAVGGAFIIGYTEIFTVAYLSPAYSSFIAFAILIVVLLVKPEGIWGDRT